LRRNMRNNFLGFVQSCLEFEFIGEGWDKGAGTPETTVDRVAK